MNTALDEKKAAKKATTQDSLSLNHQYYHERAHALTRPLTHPPTHLLATCCSRYAARLAVRHSATDATERISEMLQSYLLAAHYAAAQAQAQAQAQAAEAAEAAEVELKGQEPSVAAVVPHGAQDVHVAAARHGALEERFELAKKEALRPGADRWGRVEGKEGGAPRRTLVLTLLFDKCFSLSEINRDTKAAPPCPPSNSGIACCLSGSWRCRRWRPAATWCAARQSPPSAWEQASLRQRQETWDRWSGC